MGIVPGRPYGEVRRHEDDERLRGVSEATLWYMHDHGVSLESRLLAHRSSLGYVAEEEYDLLPVMRLLTRMANVDRNIVAAGRRVERVRAELVRRTRTAGVSGAFPFTAGEEHARKK